eukprot:TRINITY_DN42617_c0_g1_i1.p1 TRINITY_DN42617_c0_g1~~TRINITY_DN42617_c0_g1_i1.p1  ORF type:complete len:101 (-),score=9.57 TRINITY_DN42617_c0_g1_i1:13-315(-)
MRLDTKFRGTHFSRVSAADCFCVILFMIYVFGLPFWSYLANDKLGYFQELCTTPAEFVQCGNGLNYTEIAENLSRRRPASYLKLSLWQTSKELTSRGNRG